MGKTPRRVQTTQSHLPRHSKTKKNFWSFVFNKLPINQDGKNINDLLIIHALNYVFIKIKALKQLSEFGFHEQIMVELNMTKRLDNLQKILLRIVNEFRENDLIKNFTFNKEESIDLFFKKTNDKK